MRVQWRTGALACPDGDEPETSIAACAFERLVVSPYLLKGSQENAGHLHKFGGGVIPSESEGCGGLETGVNASFSQRPTTQSLATLGMTTLLTFPDYV